MKQTQTSKTLLANLANKQKQEFTIQHVIHALTLPGTNEINQLYLALTQEHKKQDFITKTVELMATNKIDNKNAIDWLGLLLEDAKNSNNTAFKQAFTATLLVNVSKKNLTGLTLLLANHPEYLELHEQIPALKAARKRIFTEKMVDFIMYSTMRTILTITFTVLLANVSALMLGTPWVGLLIGVIATGTNIFQLYHLHASSQNDESTTNDVELLKAYSYMPMTT
ncbi:MAG: hypothetical protein ACK4PR_00880, partial [Gammaproteobacteria bacterium]